MHLPWYAATVPDRTALVVAGSDQQVTYAELDDRSARLASLLRDAGLRPGDTVLLVLRNDVRWAEVFWACLRSGLYLAAADRHLSGAELEPIVRQARPAAVVTSADLTGGLDDAMGCGAAPADAPAPAAG